MSGPVIGLGSLVFVGAGVVATVLDKFTARLLRDHNRGLAHVLQAGMAAEPSRMDSEAAPLLRQLVQRLEHSKPVLFPWFELAFAVLALMGVHRFGPTWEFVRVVAFLGFALPITVIGTLALWTAYTPFVLTMTGTLVALATSLLPGTLSPIDVDGLFPAGLSAEMSSALGALANAILGAGVGVVPLLLIAGTYRHQTGRRGLEGGVLMASTMIGAFCGLRLVLVYLLVAVSVGAVVGLALKRIGLSMDGKVSFSPIQCLSGIVAIYWGEDLIRLWRTLTSA